MKAVVDIGHRVIGIEGSQKAIETFFEEHNIPYEIEKDENNQCQIYKVNKKDKNFLSCLLIIHYIE